MPALWPARLRPPHKALKAKLASFRPFHFGQKLMPALEKAGQADGARVVYYPQSATALPLLILTICILPAAITINGNHMANRKPPKHCKRSSLTGAAEKKAFVLFPFIRVVFSRRCNAICTMRKWSRWAGPKKTARLPIGRRRFQNTAARGGHKLVCRHLTQAGRAGRGLLRRLQYCQTGRRRQCRL